MREQLGDLAYAAGWGLVKRLPEPLAVRLFDGIADFAWRRRGKSVLRLEANLRRVRPDASAAELAELTRAGMRSYMRYWCESFRMSTWGRERIAASFAPEHVDRLDEALAAGRGVVLALPHMGNWDLAGAWVVVTRVPFTTVAERLKPEKLFDRFVAYREGLGMEVLPLTGGAGTLGTLAKRLRAGGLVCLVGDRDLSASGVEVEFIGEATRMPAGPAALADGRGVVLALPHMGNWDLAGAWVVVTRVPFTTVAERLKPEKLFDRFVAYREGLGMEVLPLTGGAGTLGTLAKRLRAGGLVCLVGDRDLSASGVQVDFLGEATRMPAGPAALAVQTGAALLPVTLWYDGTPVMKGRVHEPVPQPEDGDKREKVAAMTQAMARGWGAGVREHPQDWHMLQRFWLADLEPREPRPGAAPAGPPAAAEPEPGAEAAR